MKYLSLILLFASSSAFACPNLTGSFSCTQDGHTFDQNITQSEHNGVTIYNINGQPVPADGIEKSSPDDEYTRNSKYTVTCDGSQLFVNYNGTLLDSGRAIGEYEGETSIFIDNDNNLAQNDHVVITMNGQQQDQNFNSVCIRN